MGKKNRILFLTVLITSLCLGGFGQQSLKKIPNIERFEKLPVFLEIDKLTNCPVEIVHLNLGKIKVRNYRDGSGTTSRKLAESFEISPAVIKAAFWDVQPVIQWFHRLKELKNLERKTVSVILRHPETRRLVRVNLWHAWPSDITLKQEGEYPAVYITFQAENLKIFFPQ